MTDRLHSGGPSPLPGSFNLLLRRTTKFADICDYPEKTQNIWERETSRGNSGDKLDIQRVQLFRFHQRRRDISSNSRAHTTDSSASFG